MREARSQPESIASVRIRVWDLPTRLFHWSLFLLVTASIACIKIGGNWVQWHFRCGYGILALLAFRLLWGLWGTRYARFSHFPLRPSAVWDALRSLPSRARARGPGHNPLGALSIVAMLAALAFQAVSGLFCNDEVSSQGPLAPFVSSPTSHFISELHSINAVVIYVLLGLHGVAIGFYGLFKRTDLVTPMITGNAILEPPGSLGSRVSVPIKENWETWLRAALLLAACALVVWYIVSRTPPAIGS